MCTCLCMHVCVCVCMSAVRVCVLAEFCSKVFALSVHVCMCVPDMCINTPTEQQRIRKEQVFSVGAATPQENSNICLMLGDRQHI